MRNVLCALCAMFLFVGCDHSEFDGECHNERINRAYTQQYIPWHEQKGSDTPPMSCSDWFIRIEQLYRDVFSAEVGEYVDPYEVLEYFYDEGMHRLFEQVFGYLYAKTPRDRGVFSLWCLFKNVILK